MATVTKKQFRARQFGDTPYGNLSHLPFVLKTNAAGGALDADSAAAIGNGDKVKLILLPAGFKLVDSIFTVPVAFTAAVVAKMGFEYADGVDSADVPQDDDYFGAAIAINATGVYRKSAATAPVVLPKPAWLILTTGGAANAKAAHLEGSVIGELLGPA